MKEFKQGLNHFLMEIVTGICFDGQNLPDQEVINSMVELLLPKPRNQERSKLNFADFNLNPSLKSNLFQILLNFDQKMIEQHLENILSKSANYLRTNYEVDDLSGLRLMYLNAIEDNFYSKKTQSRDADGSRADIRQSLRFLKDLSNKDHDINSDELTRLKTAAKIRFVTTIISKVLADDEADDEVELIEAGRKFFEDDSSIWPRYYLIKYMFRRYGRNVLLSSANKKASKWVIPGEFLSRSVDVR